MNCFVRILKGECVLLIGVSGHIDLDLCPVEADRDTTKALGIAMR